MGAFDGFRNTGTGRIIPKYNDVPEKTMDHKSHTTTTITTKKVITLAEDQLEQLLIEEGCAKFNCTEDKISVEFDVHHDIIQEVRIVFEDTLVEEK